MEKDLMMRVNRIIERILSDSEEIIDKPLEKKDLYDLIYSISKQLGVPDLFYVDSKKAEYVPKGMFDIVGEYMSSSHKISITFIFSPKNEGNDLGTMKWAVWQYFKGMIFDTISHEICHFYQDDRRAIRGVSKNQRLCTKLEYKSIIKNDDHETGLYLLNPDEIDAHAYNAASQMYRRYGSLSNALRALRIGKYCETIDYYREYISPLQRPYKRFMRKVVSYLIVKYSETPENTVEQQSEGKTINVDDNKE